MYGRQHPSVHYRYKFGCDQRMLVFVPLSATARAAVASAKPLLEAEHGWAEIDFHLLGAAHG